MTFRQPVSKSASTAKNIAVGGHDISHYHGNSEKMHASPNSATLFQSELLAGFIDRLEKKQKKPMVRASSDHLCLVLRQQP